MKTKQQKSSLKSHLLNFPNFHNSGRSPQLSSKQRYTITSFSYRTQDLYIIIVRKYIYALLHNITIKE